MSNTSTLDLSSLYDYLLENSLRDDPLLQKLRDETALDPMSGMQIAPEQGQFMALLVKLTGARRIIEIGTFTGYSSLCMARALPEDGYILCCDVTKKWTDIAQRYWREADVEAKIDLKLAPASKTLNQLLDNHQQASFDLAFIDANKAQYDEYYELCLDLLKSNGLIILDNMLWGGKVADSSVDDEDTRAIRDLNQKLKTDERIDLSLLPMSDGIALARKR